MDSKRNEDQEAEVSEASTAVGQNSGTSNGVRIQSIMSPRLKASAYSESTFLVLYLCTQAAGALSLGSILIWIWSYNGGFSWADYNVRFNFHPICMVFGMVYLSGNSILAFRVLRNQPKPLVKVVHAAMHIAAFTMALIGSIAVFTNHLEAKLPNLYSLHSWIGLATMKLFFLQYVAGFFNFLFPTTSGALRAALLPYHVLGGFAIFGMAVVASLTGFAEKMAFQVIKYNDFSGRMWLMNFQGMLLLIFALLVFYLGTERSYRRHAVGEQLPLASDFRMNSSGPQSPSSN